MLGLLVVILLYKIIYSTAIDLDLDLKFHIKANQEPIPKFLADELNGALINDDNGVYEVFTIANDDVNMLCFLPDSINNSLWKSEESHSPNASTKQLLDLILPNFQNFFDAQLCTFTTGLNDGYWTYGYCFGDKIIQFHESMEYFQRTGQHIAEYPNYVFVLGRFEGSNSREVKILNQSTNSSRILDPNDFDIIIDPLTRGQSSKPQKSIRHVLKNGGICNLTKKPRTVEVIYRCDPNMAFDIALISVSEIKICEYRAIINVKGLCAFDELSPPHTDEKIVNIVCNQVVNNAIEGSKTEVKAFMEFQLPTDNLPQFPQPKFTHIDLYDYRLLPGGNGYYWGRPHNHDSSRYIYDRRSIVVYNGYDTDIFKRIDSFATMFSESMESKVVSPLQDHLATWNDSFIAWYELYDYKGNFLNVIRLFRNGTLDDKVINVQFIDPFSMVDQDGNIVDIPIPTSTNRKIYEYQLFVKANSKAKENELYTTVVTVTKQLIVPSASSSPKPGDESDSDESHNENIVVKIVDGDGNTLSDDMFEAVLKVLQQRDNQEIDHNEVNDIIDHDEL